MSSRQFLQSVMHNWQTLAQSAIQLRDIQMPKCGPNRICNIWGIRVTWDQTAFEIRWRLFLSLEPSDRFEDVDVDGAYLNDIFYRLNVLMDALTSGVADAPRESTVMFPIPFAYPYEKLRAGNDASTGVAADWHIQILYTIDEITSRQLTAITVRRGTTRHARPGGPEA